MAKFRQAKSRIIHGNDEDGFASPIFDVAESLRQLQKEKKVKLAKLHRQFHGLDPDPFDREFERFERELSGLGGDSDTYYRRHGFKDGKPHKKSEYVDFDSKSGRLVHADVCNCGRRLVSGECPVCSKKSDDWLRIG